VVALPTAGTTPNGTLHGVTTEDIAAVSCRQRGLPTGRLARASTNHPAGWRAPMPRTALALAAVTLLAFLAGCGASSSHHTPPEPHPSLTAAQAAGICRDVNSWLVGAVNLDKPKFSATLTADEQKANGTALGHDLSTLDYDTQTQNSAALLPGPPGNPTAFGALTQVCAGHGVTLKLGD
jgi:hypothetical protein